jgi:ABC-type multidrug transport system fused ATPase/permease subunit
VGGVDVDQLAAADVRAALGLVDQDAHLFAGTIGTNVTLGRPGATEAEVAEALSLAQLGEWVASLPDGLNTPVGERGERLSGGQRQRVAVARTLLAGCQVLVLDEPTAGLDRQAGLRLLADIRRAGAERSLLLITHRPDELLGMHEVLEIENGRVTAARRLTPEEA